MKRLSGAMFVAVLALGGVRAASADEKEATAVLDKAIKAIGGEEKLGKAKAFTWKTKGVLTLNGSENELIGQGTSQGLDHYRAEAEGEFNGNKFKVVTVVNGDKGWRKIGDNIMPLDDDQLATEKRMIYLQAAATTVLPIKGKGFKVATAPEEKVGDKPADVVKVTGPDGKDFTIYFDKETSLPVKLVAKVNGFTGEEATQESLYKDYKEFDGIKRATKVEVKRDGERFLLQDVSEMKALDKVEPGTFDEPQ